MTSIKISNLESSRKVFSGLDNIIVTREKERKINKAIREFLWKQKMYGEEIWHFVVPIGTTGRLALEGLDSSRPKKRPYGYTLEFGVNRIKSAGSYEESKYPLFVHDGTTGPIFAKRGNVLALRDKTSNTVFAVRHSVAGQEAQPFMDEFEERLDNHFARQSYQLAQKIQRIIES